jgi:hypothetical protein
LSGNKLLYMTWSICNGDGEYLHTASQSCVSQFFCHDPKSSSQSHWTSVLWSQDIRVIQEKVEMSLYNKSNLMQQKVEGIFSGRLAMGVENHLLET